MAGYQHGVTNRFRCGRCGDRACEGCSGSPCRLCGVAARDGVCGPCHRRVDDSVAWLPSAYRGLGAQLVPSGSDPGREHVSGSRTPAAPVRVDVLDLRARGGVGSWLRAWEIHWRAVRCFGMPGPVASLELELVAAVGWVRGSLGWAEDEARDFPVFVSQLGDVTVRLRRALGLGAAFRLVGSCPVLMGDVVCGAPLSVSGADAVVACGLCGASWDRTAWLALAQLVNEHVDSEMEGGLA